MIRSMYPFWSAATAAILAQVSKPIFYYFKTGTWNWRTMGASGGFPSSHAALVSALTLSVGLNDNFRSTIFAVTAAFAIIVVYDAANVRYYTGQNIRITKQLIKDLQEELPVDLDDPIYETKLKDVIGHKWTEVFGGIILGICVALVYYYFI